MLVWAVVVGVAGAFATSVFREGIQILQRLLGNPSEGLVALVNPPFTLKADTREVADIFEVPLAWLMNPANHEVRVFRWEGGERRFFAMPYTPGERKAPHFIWGATAGMLRNFYRFLAARA